MIPESNRLSSGQKVGQGRFTLVRMLGEGGMGMVWLATDDRLHEEVALKFLHPSLQSDPLNLEHLRRETARSHRLSHPNIVRIHDFYEPLGECPFISMEYIDGTTLDALRSQRKDGVFPWSELRLLIQQLCEALQYAHDEGVIHRDLKPANLMVNRKGQLKLADFGIAAMVNVATGQISVHRSGGGTSGYMSPQQTNGAPPQVGDDIYALGASLYHLLTGKPPFYAGVIDYQVMHGTVEPPSMRLKEFEIQNDIPEPVEATILACLAKTPEERPPSVREMWQRLEQEAIGARASRPAGESEVAMGSQSAAGMDEVMENQRTGKPAFLVAGVFALLALLALGGWYGVKHLPQKSGENSRVQNGTGKVSKPPTMATKEAPWINSLGMRFLTVPGFKALICSTETSLEVYQVFVTETSRHFEAPSFVQGKNHPVVMVTWEDTEAFCKWLTLRERTRNIIGEKHHYRLPRDREWSVAVGLTNESGATPRDLANKGSAIFLWGANWPPPAQIANLAGEELKSLGLLAIQGYSDPFVRTAPVGSFMPNQYGIHDLVGNVAEWCDDSYDGGSRYRVVRGSSWRSREPALISSAARFGSTVDYRSPDCGFRIVLDY